MKIIERTIYVADNVATGKMCRDYRLRKGLALREVAKRMGFSAACICNSEHGKRGWTQTKVDAFQAACDG